MGKYLTFLMLGVALLLPVRMQAAETLTQQFNTLSAKVTKIDKSTHTLTLLNDRNETRVIQVDPAQVRNFDNIKVGDNVVIRERQSVALSFEKPSPGAAMTAERAPAGSRPGVSVEGTETIKAEIIGIDKANNLVSLKGPEGNVVRVLAKDPSRLEGLKIGEKVWATYTKAMAISVDPAP